MSYLDMTTDEIRAAYCDGRDMHSRVVALCDALDEMQTAYDASQARHIKDAPVFIETLHKLRDALSCGAAAESRATQLQTDYERANTGWSTACASIARLEARLDVALGGTDDLHEFVTDASTKLDRLIDLWRETEDDLEAETESLQTTAAAWGRNVRHSDEQQARAETAEARIEAAGAIFYRDYPAENAATARAMAIALDVCDQ